MSDGLLRIQQELNELDAQVIDANLHAAQPPWYIGLPMIRVYIHVAGRRVRSADYECHDGFGPGFPVARAIYHFNEACGPHTYRHLARGQEGFDYAFHLEARRTRRT